MKIQTLSVLSLLFISLTGKAQVALSPLVASFEEYKSSKESTLFHPDWIPLGPVLNSALVESVQLDPTRPGTMYIAFGSGNLWKTVNHGLSWKPIFENQAALGIGDIALAPSNPSIIYLGTGESLKKDRNFTLPGTGVYRSDDGGETWRHLGLSDSWHIGEIAIHPKNPDIAYVAVMGKFWSPHTTKGIFRTKNGGRTWEQVLYVDENTRANDVVIAPSNPNVIYASMWENNLDTTLAESVYGPKSSVYKSRDGGKTWKKMDNGLPQGPKTGRIGLAVSYTNHNKVYALVDNLNNKRDEAAEVYKSLDGGKTWSRPHSDPLMIFSVIGWYFADIYVNPQDDEEIFALGVRLAKSSDGGKNFEIIGGDIRHINPSPAQTLHLDHCELWINPLNPNQLALGNDGGFYLSYDKGHSWLHYNNIPAGEFYHITVDNRQPYMIYGGVQDDATVFGPAKEYDPRFDDPWQYLWIDAWSGGDGCYTQVDPDDSNTVYFSLQEGVVRRKDMRADTSVGIRPKLPKGMESRLQFNFVTPYIISPHNSKTLYHAGNYIFKSTDRGDSWDLISGDISKSADPRKKSFAAGALAESELKKGLIYAGTDKGAFWVSQDDGLHWKEHSNGLPGNYIRSICPSRFKQSRVYVSLTGINYDDLGNYLFVSEDYGETWRSINTNLPNEIANVILEDPKHENILYAGLYRGVYISMDRGKSWSLMGASMPAASVSDMIVQRRENDLVVSTHGRGIYLLNLDPIHALYEMGGTPASNHLFEIPPATRPKYRDTHGDVDLKTVEKVPVSFWLKETAPVKLSVVDGDGKEVWSISLEGKKGFNQFRWDLVTKRQESNLPYFIHYQEFIKAGKFRFFLDAGGELLEREMVVKDYH